MDKDNINWLPQEDYDKSVGQLRLQLNAVFKPFKIYGLQDFVPNAVNEAVKLCEDFGLRVRGVDKAISLEMIRNRHNGDMFSGRQENAHKEHIPHSKQVVMGPKRNADGVS